MKTFTLKNFELQCGAALPEAEIVYETYGELAGDRRNVILYPTSYGAQHTDIDWLIRPDGILKCDRHKSSDLALTIHIHRSLPYQSLPHR